MQQMLLSLKKEKSNLCNDKSVVNINGESVLNLKNKKVFLDSGLLNRKYSDEQKIDVKSLNKNIDSLGL